LDAAEHVHCEPSFGPVFDAAEKCERRAIRVASIVRAFAFAISRSGPIVADECFVADNDALGVLLAAFWAARVLGGLIESSVHNASSPFG
jgi:hypothetical protein